MKFGPDIGQLQKGGVDPVAVVKNFLPVVEHMHFKDWNGGPSMAGYCALGLGKVDLTGVLDLMEGRKLQGMIMVELDSGGEMPYTPREARRSHTTGWSKTAFRCAHKTPGADGDEVPSAAHVIIGAHHNQPVL